jgi:MFS family permease
VKRFFRASNVVLLLLCAMYFITYLDRVNVSTAADGFGKEFGLSKTQIGLAFSAFAYPYLVFQIVGGWISDRFGARRTLIACGLVWGVATALTGLSGGLLSMLSARVLLGLGEGATFPASTTAMSRWIPRDRRGFAQGITHAASRIGNAVAPAAVVAIMTVYGWRASFFVCGAISLAWVGLWSLTFTERPLDHPRITHDEIALLPQPKPKPTYIPWKQLAKRMAPVMIVYFCYGWTLWLFLSWVPQYFLHSYNLDLKKSALFASSVFFAGVLGDTLGGVLTDRILKRTGSLRTARSVMVAACMMLSLLSLLPLIWMHDLYVSLTCLSAGFFFAEMTIGPMWAIPMDIAPEFCGVASGMMNTGSALAAILSPVLSGLLIDRVGSWELPFICSMLLMAAGVVLALRMHPERRFVAEPSTPVTALVHPLTQ